MRFNWKTILIIIGALLLGVMFSENLRFQLMKLPFIGRFFLPKKQ